MSLKFYDAHNHLQDERFAGRQAELLAACARENVACMVVNGSCETDWAQVRDLLAAADVRRRTVSSTNGIRLLTSAATASGKERPREELHPQVLPSFGYHPWYVGERSADWLKKLAELLDQIPSAVGEIGLDRWKPGLSYEHQEEVFIAQLNLAAQRNLPVSIHCLQAWGRMLEILKAERRPACGFLLHSYGGSKEMVKSFADLGAYFSLPGYYAHERKQRQRETFKQVPLDRLLIETDAPDQILPETRIAHPLTDAAGKPLNHPANLRAVYEFAAELFGEPSKKLATRVEENFSRLFGALL